MTAAVASSPENETFSETLAPWQGPWVGRRPRGLIVGAYPEAQPAGRYFARMAECEAASLAAFQLLSRELEAHGAPMDLVEEARAAAANVLRHIDPIHELAVRFGTDPALPLFNDPPLRDVYEVAFDNGIEGCIRQTYGALLATYQSKAAKDLVTREIMSKVAPDETHQAAFAWRAQVWLERCLAGEEIACIRRAQHDTLDELHAEGDAGLSDFECGLLGLPRRRHALTMLDRLAGELWTTTDPSRSRISLLPVLSTMPRSA